MPEPIPAPRASGFTTSTAVPLYWVKYGGAGDPPLLILHGGPGAHHDYLLPQMLRLTERHALVLYDQRGGGRSRTDDRTPITWRMQVEDLALVIDELGLASAAMVGYSWGALLALLYCIEAFGRNLAAPIPERLVLISPAPLSRTFRRRFEEEFARRQQGAELQELRAELQSSGLRERDPAAYRQRLFELGVAGYFADPSRAAGLTPFRVTGRVQESIWESLGDFDLIPTLGTVECPTLLLHGSADPIPLESAEAAAAALPVARLVTIPDAGHVPYVESPEPLFDAIFGFLAEPPAAENP